MNTKSTKQFVSFLFENVKRTEQFEANKNKLKKLEARLIELENLAKKIKDDADEQRRETGQFDSYMIDSKEEIELTKIDDERRNIEAKIENINKEQKRLEKIPADQPTKGEIERSGSTTAARGRRLPKVQESKNRFRSTEQFVDFLLENIDD